MVHLSFIIIPVKWTPPKWLKAIPKGSHGSTDVQKRLWKLTSDVVRIQEWYKYKRCVSCSKPIARWQDGQCGHFKNYSVCNSYFKFDRRNLALECAYCNSYGGMDAGYQFGKELKRRGIDLEKLAKDNLKMSGQKMYDHELIHMIEELLNTKLPEYPDYFKRVKDLI